MYVNCVCLKMSWKFVISADQLHVCMGIMVQVTTKGAKAAVHLAVTELQGYIFLGGE